MAKTIKTKYGTVLNVDGLSAEQVARVRQTAEGNGAYGGKGAALADALRKENDKKKAKPNRADPVTSPQAADPVATNPTTTTPETPADAGIDVGTDPKKSAVDENAILAQAPTLFGSEDLLAEAAKARDANYAYLSRDFASNKATQIENKKQELANRGIPYSDDPNSPYGKAIKQIETQFADLDMQARNQSISGGNETINTLSTASTNANQAFMKNVLGLTDAELTKYGIDQDTLTKLRNIAAQKEIANKKQAGSGNQGSNISIGGNAPGF